MPITRAEEITNLNSVIHKYKKKKVDIYDFEPLFFFKKEWDEWVAKVSGGGGRRCFRSSGGDDDRLR